MEEDLEVEETKYRSFAFTLRKTKMNKVNPVSRDDYLLHVVRLVETLGCKLYSHVFEKTGGLHMHGVIEIAVDTPLIRFRVRGWKMHLKEIWNYVGWQQYIAKESMINYNEGLGPKLRESLFK